MDVDTALKFVEDLLIERSAKTLSDDEKAVFKGSWERLTYLRIELQYQDEISNPSDIRQTGSDLWNKLAELFKLPQKAVTKKIFRGVVEQQYRLREKSFIDTTNDTDPSFVGRDQQIEELHRLADSGTRLIEIQAAGGVGKTTLAREFLKKRSLDIIIDWSIGLTRESIASAESVVEEWLKRYLKEEASREFNVSLNALGKVLGEKRVGILIDNLEPALDGKGKFQPEFCQYVDLLKSLSKRNLQSLTLITTRECIQESFMEEDTRFPLETLSSEAWQEYFDLKEIKCQKDTLKKVHHAYGGNPKAMTTLSGEVLVDFEGDFDEYWKQYGDDLLINPVIENLITKQFDRLEEIHPLVYRLLIRMGCYRYQDVPRITNEGLYALLWDIEVEREKRKIVRNLKKRAIIESNLYEFWLHPVIRFEAISRLKQNPEEWRQANINAGRFLDDVNVPIETIENTKNSFEAFRHYYSVQEYELALRVLVSPRRYSEDKRPFCLGTILSMFGFILQTRREIIDIIPHVENMERTHILYNILGDMYWLTGDLQVAIEYHETSLNILRNRISFSSSTQKIVHEKERYEYSGNLNLALCSFYLWDLERAYQHVGISVNIVLSACEIDSAFDYFRQERLAASQVLKSLVEFEIGLTNQAKKSLESAIITYKETQLSLNIWGRIWFGIFAARIFNNLTRASESKDILDSTFRVIEHNKFRQAEGKILSVYGDTHRLDNDFQESLQCHRQAIEILETMQAKADLAEAYFFKSLTHRDMGDKTTGETLLQQSQKLYQNINAPLQIERINKAFYNG